MTLFGTSTVSALVTRGLAGFTRWQHGKGGDFPVCVTLRPETVDTSAEVTVHTNVQLGGSSDPVTVVEEDPDDE